MNPPLESPETLATLLLLALFAIGAGLFIVRAVDELIFKKDDDDQL